MRSRCGRRTTRNSLARVALARAQFHRREQLKTIVGVILRVALPVAYLAWVWHEWDTHRSLLGAIGCMFGVYVALRGFLAMVEKLYR